MPLILETKMILFYLHINKLSTMASNMRLDIFGQNCAVIHLCKAEFHTSVSNTRFNWIADWKLGHDWI